MSMLHPLTEKLLRNRGILGTAAQESFLSPDYTRDLHDPFLILNMEKATERILSALGKNEYIIIYGDYDCDGIPASVVLHDLFKKIGYTNFSNYIPHRHLEGYGLNVAAIERFAKDGAALIVTVDCGITDVVEVELANELGVDVIITDHHLPQAKLPPAYAVINSKQTGDTYPDNMLCGAGVAFKLAQALIKRGNFSTINDGWEKWLLDMAGLSTIADMVPLINENRALAYFGLKVLRRSPRPGLQALLSDARVDQRYLTEEDVGFTIGPRINAASRMDVPLRAFEMLSTQDVLVAGERALHLSGLNVARKLEVARMMKEAKKILHAREMREVILVGNPSWKVGVVGIVANQLAEEYDRPAFVWGREDSPNIKGSCRSDGRVNMVELMCAAPADTFIDKGGHEFSGGFSLSHEKMHTLEDSLVAALANTPKKEKPLASYQIDAELKVSDVVPETFNAIDLLAPFGVGNQRPHFLFPAAEVASLQRFGKGKEHLKLMLVDKNNRKTEAIGFFTGPEDFPDVDLEMGAKIDLVATMEQSHFRGRPELRLRIANIAAV
jgi:single-stranded-DNA-specific exonuclease